MPGPDHRQLVEGRDEIRRLRQHMGRDVLDQPSPVDLFIAVAGLAHQLVALPQLVFGNQAAQPGEVDQLTGTPGSGVVGRHRGQRVAQCPQRRRVLQARDDDVDEMKPRFGKFLCIGELGEVSPDEIDQ